MADKTPRPRKTSDSIGETPTKPGKKPPSEWGVGDANSRSPGNAGQSPTKNL
jgi:hypothetical protein